MRNFAAGGEGSLTPEWVSAVGGIFTLLLAVMAIALQIRELRLQREELAAQREELAKTVSAQEDLAEADRRLGYLSSQITLVRMAIEDPDLRPILGGPVDEYEGSAWKQAAYMNLLFRMFASEYAYTDGRSERAARATIGFEVFETDFAIKRWENMAPLWRAYATTDLEQQFCDLVDEEWLAAKERRSRAEPKSEERPKG
ncbi:MAG: DUF6082 family protein [Actinomycetota bacterium]